MKATGTLSLLKPQGQQLGKAKDPEIPIRLLQEEDINTLQSKLCEACVKHVKEYTHLTGGRGLQHVLSDNEISLMILENTRKDLLSILTVN